MERRMHLPVKRGTLRESGQLRDRRRFLQAIATGTLGVAVLPAVRQAGSARADGKAWRASAAPSAPGGPRRLTFAERLGPDGLPVGGVAGTFIGTEGSTVLVGITSPPVGVIRVGLTGMTSVLARGSIVQGNVSGCQPGDRVNIGTYFSTDAQRVAEYINANAFAYWAQVTQVSDTSLTAIPYYAGSAWPAISALTIPETTVYSRDADVPPAHGTSAAESILAVGDGIHMTGLGSSGGPNPDTLWTVTIHQLGGWEAMQGAN